MTYDYEYDDDASGYCEDCGLDLDEDPGGGHEDSHRKCWACWRADQGGHEEPQWRKPRPEPGTPPPSVVEGLARVREELAELRARLDRLERGRAA
jgi:hypothetical protein